MTSGWPVFKFIAIALQISLCVSCLACCCRWLIQQQVSSSKAIHSVWIAGVFWLSLQMDYSRILEDLVKFPNAWLWETLWQKDQGKWKTRSLMSDYILHILYSYDCSYIAHLCTYRTNSKIHSCCICTMHNSTSHPSVYMQTGACVHTYRYIPEADLWICYPRWRLIHPNIFFKFITTTDIIIFVLCHLQYNTISFIGKTKKVRAPSGLIF